MYHKLHLDIHQGWERNEEGELEPIWTAGPIMPSSLVEILAVEADSEEEEEEQDETIEDDMNNDEEDY